MVHLSSQCGLQDSNKGDAIETSTNFQGALIGPLSLHFGV
jgi:hypothetical protein